MMSTGTAEVFQRQHMQLVVGARDRANTTPGTQGSLASSRLRLVTAFVILAAVVRSKGRGLSSRFNTARVCWQMLQSSPCLCVNHTPPVNHTHVLLPCLADCAMLCCAVLRVPCFHPTDLQQLRHVALHQWWSVQGACRDPWARRCG
jgi:hypothetical protein